MKCPGCGHTIPRAVNFCAYGGEKIRKESFEKSGQESEKENV